MEDVDTFIGLLGEAFTEHFDNEDPSEETVKKEPVRVPRIAYDSLTPEEFASKYSATNTPVILGDAFTVVPMHLNLQYWAEHHGHKPVPLDLGTPSEKVVRFGDFLEGSDPDLVHRYCRSLHTFDWFPKENRTLSLPGVFGHNYLAATDKGYPGGWHKWFELFINSRECQGFPFLHVDMCATHAYSLQVQGIKRFHLFPPSDSEFLYPYGNMGTRSFIDHNDIVGGFFSALIIPVLPHVSLITFTMQAQ